MPEGSRRSGEFFGMRFSGLDKGLRVLPDDFRLTLAETHRESLNSNYFVLPLLIFQAEFSVLENEDFISIPREIFPGGCFFEDDAIHAVFIPDKMQLVNGVVIPAVVVSNLQAAIARLAIKFDNILFKHYFLLLPAGISIAPLLRRAAHIFGFRRPSPAEAG